MLTEKFEELLNIPLAQLIYESDKVREKFIGSELEICSIVNAK